MPTGKYFAYAAELCRPPILPACDCLAIDDARAGPQPRERIDNERKPVRQIVAWPAIEPLPLLPGDYPEAVVLDFDQPFRPRGWLPRGRHGAINPAGRERKLDMLGSTEGRLGGVESNPIIRAR